jgi:starch phosphorylase
VKVEGVETPEAPVDLGGELPVTAVVSLGSLGPADVEVQLLHGPVGQHDEIAPASVVAMTPEPSDASRWTAGFTCDRAGRYGYTVRIVPSHPDLTNPIDLGRIAWA